MIEKLPIAGVISFTEGELTHYINQGDSLKITRKESKDSYRNIIQLNKTEDFIKVYLKPMMLLSHELTSPECTVLFYILQYVNFKNGMLMENRATPLRRKTIALELDQTIRTIDRIMNSLVRNEVLVKITCGRNISYCTNPFIFMRGKMVNTFLMEMFAKTKYAELFGFDYQLETKSYTTMIPEIKNLSSGSDVDLKETDEDLEDGEFISGEY